MRHYVQNTLVLYLQIYRDFYEKPNHVKPVDNYIFKWIQYNVSYHYVSSMLLMFLQCCQRPLRRLLLYCMKMMQTFHLIN